MAILGLDIGKSKFDAHLLIDERSASIHLTNDQAGFDELHTWLERHNPGRRAALHACMEATGNYGLDLAVFLHGQGIKVSVINPKQIKAFGQAELRRNKTDKLDAPLRSQPRQCKSRKRLIRPVFRFSQKRRFPVPATRSPGKLAGLRQAWPKATAQRREAGFTKT